MFNVVKSMINQLDNVPSLGETPTTDAYDENRVCTIMLVSQTLHLMSYYSESLLEISLSHF